MDKLEKVPEFVYLGGTCRLSVWYCSDYRKSYGTQEQNDLNTSVWVNDVHPRALPELTDEVAEVLATVTNPSLKTVLGPEA